VKRLFISFVVGGILGLAVGFGVGIFVYPYLFLADIVAEETVPDRESKRVVATGKFIHVNPSDPIHYGQGSLTAFEDMIHLESDFEVGPGPKYHVYLVPSASVRSESDVEGSEFRDLGRLRAFKGSQNYRVPEGVDISRYGSVVIWCEQFGVLISPAMLKFSSG